MKLLDDIKKKFAKPPKPTLEDIMHGASTYQEHRLFDKYINIQWWHNAVYKTQYNPTIEADERVLVREEYVFCELDTMESGYKPDITVSLKQLPDAGIIVGLTVKIINLNLPADLPMQSISRMVVEMGYYSTQAKQQYNSIVFRSYQSSPDPDGETVFEGVIVGNALQQFWQTQVSLDIYKKDATPKEVIQMFCDAFSSTVLSMRKTIVVKFAPQAESSDFTTWLNTPLNALCWTETTTRTHWEASNGLAAFSWLVNWLQQSAKPYGLSIYGQLTDQGFVIGSLQNSGTISGINIDNIPCIDMVYTISFNAVMLEITCPWIPLVQTGSLISVNPTFFSQTSLPNSVDVDTYKSADTVYRVLLVEIDFGTINANTMKITALPWQYTDKDVSDITKSVPTAAGLIEDIRPIHMQLGNPVPDNVDLDTAPTKDGILVTINPGDGVVLPVTFNQYAEKFYEYLPPVSPKKDLNDQAPLSIRRLYSNVRRCNLWPLVVMCSYTHPTTCTKINPKAPTWIPVGKVQYMYYPIQKWSEVKDYIEDIKTVKKWCEAVLDTDETAAESYRISNSDWETLVKITEGGYWK